MNEKTFQLFLSLMDTIHDYGDTGRTKMCLLKKSSMDEEEGDVNPEEESIQLKHISFNPSFIIDFLILGYVHNMFREMLDLDKKQTYLKSKTNCSGIDNIYEQNNVVKTKICENFYFPTYGERFFFRSPSPEEFTKAILMDYLETKGISYGKLQHIEFDKIMEIESYNLDLYLGNVGLGNIVFDNEGKFLKGPKEWYKKGNNTKQDNLRKEYIRYRDLIEYDGCYYFPRNNDNAAVKKILQMLSNKSVLKLNIDNVPDFMKTKTNKFKKVYETYENDLYKDGKLYYEIKTKPSGIFDSANASKELYLKVCKIFQCNKINYVTDANQLKNEWLFASKYNGKFLEYDSFKQNIGSDTMQDGGTDNNSNVGLDELGLSSSEDDEETQPIHQSQSIQQIQSIQHTAYQQEQQSEFQEYSLKKGLGELIFFDELGVRFIKFKNKFEVFYEKDNFARIIDTETNKRNTNNASGLSLFLLVFNEINRKTFGNARSSVPEKEKQNLKDKLDNVGLKVITQKYKISLSDTLQKNNTSNPDVLYLSRNDFILALLDLKRSMDYLYVKACSEANTKSNEDHKYVFVSNDRSAICYSLMLGNPCIHTPPKPTSGFKRGEQHITIYNPPPTNTNNTNNITKIDFKQTRKFEEEIEENGPDEDIYIPSLVDTTNIRRNISNANNKTKLCQEFEEKVRHIKAKLEKGFAVKGKLEDPFGILKSMYLKAHTKDYELSPDLSKFIETIMKTCSNSPQQTGGGNVKKDDLLNYQIPIKTDIESFLDEDEPFYEFLKFYSKLSPTITLFWYITYRSIFYFLYGDNNDLSANREYFPTTMPNQNIKVKRGMTEPISQMYNGKRNNIYNSSYIRSISNDGQTKQTRKKNVK